VGAERHLGGTETFGDCRPAACSIPATAGDELAALAVIDGVIAECLASALGRAALDLASTMRD